MKGFIFTELIEMVEQEFGIKVADQMLSDEHLSSHGVYTGVGTYPTTDIAIMVQQLHKSTQLPIPVLVQAFGRYLFSRLMLMHSRMADRYQNTFQLLENLDERIHVEVHKLYPTAELPKFSLVEKGEDYIVLHYRSERRMADLAEGLIQGSAKYFNEQLHVEREALDPEQIEVLFTIRRVS